MARANAKKKAPSRRRKVFNVKNFLFSMGFANILTQGIFKTNILAFFLEGTGFTQFSSNGGISLQELFKQPRLVEVAIGNAQKNIINMVFQSVGLAVTERVFSKVMAMPFRRIQSGIVQPLLGKGVRLG